MAHTPVESGSAQDPKKLLVQHVDHQHDFSEKVCSIWLRQKQDRRRKLSECGQEQSVQDLLEEKKKMDAVVALMLEDLNLDNGREKDSQRDSGYTLSPPVLSPCNSADMDSAKRQGCYMGPSDLEQPIGLAELIDQGSLPMGLDAMPHGKEGTEDSHDFATSEMSREDPSSIYASE